MTVKIQAQLQWRAAFSASSRKWVGICVPVNLALEAESLDELHSLIPEALHLLFVDLLEDDEFDQYLRERGWTATNVPKAHQTSDVEFDVPWELIAEGARDPERRAH